jgi:hypothetical protein
MNNKISGSGGTGLGIEVQGCPDSLIQGNTVDHWISVDTSSNSAVRNNVVSDTSGIYKYAGFELVNSADVSITGNTINGGAQIGLSESNNGTTQSTVRTYVAHNLITAASTWGVQVQGGTGGISKQYFYANTIANTLASGPATMYAPQGNGFRVNGNTQSLVLNSNTISANGGAGLQSIGSNISNLEIVNNTISNNAGQAVTLGASGITNSLWANNQVSGNGTNNSLASTANPSGEPTMTLSAPIIASIGQTVNFALNFQSPGTMTDVLWDFGDGLPLAASGSGASYVFNTPGNYTVGVVAWDSNGNAAQAETTVSIISALAIPEPVTASTTLLGIGFIALRRRSRRN